MRVLYLYSDKTGLIRNTRFHIKIAKKLSKIFEVVDVHKTLSVEDLQTKARECSKTYDVLALAGGDGSLQKVVDTISKLPKKDRPILGYIPTGTVNDSGKSFGVKGTIRQAISVLKKQKIYDIDVCKANDTHFTFVAAIGQFTDISYIASRKTKKYFGRFSYYAIAVKEAFTKKVIDINLKIDGKMFAIKAPFIMVLNGVNCGGFKVNKNNSLFDGMCDIYITKPTFLNGLPNFIFNRKNVFHFKAKHVEISTSENGPWCIDGESFKSGDLKIDVLPAHIRVFGDIKKLTEN